jgi:hypothetical protein
MQDCGKELEELGGILLSPPNENGFVRKWHLCKPCYEKIEAKFRAELPERDVWWL